MSVPKEKLYELIQLIPDDENEEVVAYLENYIEKKKKRRIWPCKLFWHIKRFGYWCRRRMQKNERRVG